MRRRRLLLRRLCRRRSPLPSPPSAPPLRNNTTYDSPSPPSAPPVLRSNTTTSDSPSPPSAPPLRSNNTTSQSPSPPPAPPLRSSASSATAEDNAPAPVALSIRCKHPSPGGVPKKYRIVRSNKTSQIVKATGKIKPNWSEFHLAPSTNDIRSLLVHDIGTAIMTHVPMAAPTFYELETHHKEAVEKYLSLYYDIPKSDLLMWKFVDRTSQRRYSDWKHKCHNHFNEHGDPTPLEFLDRPEQWQYLVKEFRDEDKKVIYLRNQENRNKNPLNHHSGSKPISYRAEEHLVEKHIAPSLAATLDVYEGSENGRELARTLKRKINEMIQDRAAIDPENVQPLSLEAQCNILEEIFGERKGRQVRGMGGAFKRPAKKQGGPRVATQEAEREKTRQAEERAAQAEEKYENLVQRFRELEANVRTLMDKQSGGASTSGSD